MSYNDESRLEGIVEITLLDEHGDIKDQEIVKNIITTVGDRYYAERGANLASPNQGDVVGMKLGTGTTAAAKSGAGATIVTYITGSYRAFDSAAAANAVGGDGGYTVDYVVTWPAGTVTNSAITEATVTSSSTDATGSAAEVISRTVFTAKNKTASDSLVITWKHKHLGA